MQVDPSRPGGMRFRDPFAQRLPRALRSTPAASETPNDGVSSAPGSEGADGGSEQDPVDLEDIATQ